MLYKMQKEDEEILNAQYIIWCDNVIPLDLEIITKTQGTRKCWLVKAEYILPKDKYKAIYQQYIK